jgi:hypothetical protein
MYIAGIGIEEGQMTFECQKQSRRGGERPELADRGYFSIDLQFRFDSSEIYKSMTS